MCRLHAFLEGEDYFVYNSFTKDLQECCLTISPNGDML